MTTRARFSLASFDSRREMTARERWIVLASCALMMALRAPLLVLSPRLITEEATVHLAHAYSNGFLRSLLLIPTAGGPAGYFQLPANLAGALTAHVLPLELAPFVSMTTAFAVQLLPIALVLWGRSYFWSTPGRRLACCAALLFAPPISPPIWLSTVNAQVFCGLAAFVVLCEDLEGASRRRIWCLRLVLAFCGLSGVYTAMLTVPFLVRALLRRSREATIQLAVVAGSAVFQLAAYATTAVVFSLHPNRVASLEWKAASVIVLLQHMAKALLTGPLAQRVELALSYDLRFNTLAGLCCLGAVVLVWIWLARRRTDRLFVLFPLTFAVVSGATSVLAFSLPRNRYAVVSGMVFVLALLVSSWSEAPSLRRTLSKVLVGISLAGGAVTYWTDLYFGKDEYRHGHFGYAPGRPDWRQELERWRRDPGYRLRVWPYSQAGSWTTDLTSRDQFRNVQADFDAVEDFHLVARRPAAERRIPVASFPPAFRIVVRGRSDHADSQVFFGVFFKDRDDELIARKRLEGFRAGEPFTQHFISAFIDISPGRSLQETRSVTLRARTNGTPVVLHVERVTIEPPVQGLLDGVLPSRDVPTGLYHASSLRPLAQEATSILALESLIRDRDLVFGPSDAARAKERWSRGPTGLELRRAAGAVRVYDQPLAHLLVALPFFTLDGPSGVVILNLVLLLVMAALLGLDLRHHGLKGKLFALAPFVAAAGCGFAFLPQPQVFEMFCLFLPVRWWLRGDLGEKPGRVLAAGVLAGATGIQEAAWLLVPAVCGIDLAIAGRRRSALTLAATALAVAALPALAPRDLYVGPPVPATSSVVTSATEDGPAAPRDGLGGLAVDTWRLYTARNGLVAGYPFALLSLVLFFRGAEHRSRLLLLAALAVLTSWVALTGAATALESPLGSPHFAVIAPLFSLLPDRPGSLRAQVVAWIVALLLTLGVMSSAWTPGGS